MPRITKKMIQEEKEAELRLQKNTNTCIGMIMQKMGLEIDTKTGDGSIRRYDEDEEEYTYLTFDGKKCVSTMMNLEIDMDTQLPFDPYGNTKLATSLLTYYISEYLGREILLVAPSNKKPNEEGHLILKFEDGEKIEGNTYFKDTLKYLDMIYILEGSAKPEYTKLKAIDTDVRAN